MTCFFPGRTMALGRTLVIPILILAPSKDALESVSRACTIMVLPAIKQIIFKGKILPRWSTLTSKYVFFPLKPLTYPIIIGRTTSPVRQIHPSASPAKSIFSSLNTHYSPPQCPNSRQTPPLDHTPSCSPTPLWSGCPSVNTEEGLLALKCKV